MNFFSFFTYDWQSACRCWMVEAACIKYHKNLHLSVSDSPRRDDTPLQATRVKKAKDERAVEILIDESEFCLEGKSLIQFRGVV